MLDLAPEPFFHFPTATRRDNKDRIWLTSDLDEIFVLRQS